MSIQSAIAASSLGARQLAASSVLTNFIQVRFRKPVYFRKYVQPHYRQKLLLAVCEPYMPVDRKPESERCKNLTPPPPKPDHPYDVLLAKDLSAELESFPLICLFHQNQMNHIDKRLASNEFEHEGMTLRYYNKDIARLCMTNNRFAPLMHFVVDDNFTVLFAPDTTKVAKIIRIAKKYPEIMLMGALVDQRRLLTLKQLEEFNKLSNLDTQRAALCHSLTVTQQSLLQSLNHHSSNLSQLLSNVNLPTDEATADEPKKE